MTRALSVRRRDASGFTLIEVLVATSLLVVGMTGVLALFGAALALESEAEERTVSVRRLGRPDQETLTLADALAVIAAEAAPPDGAASEVAAAAE